MTATTTAPARSRYEQLASRAWIAAFLGWVALLILPLALLGQFEQRQIVLIAVYCMTAAGLNLSFGYAGELALGQVAVMAAGAYTTAVLAHDGVTSLFIQLPASIAMAALLGFITGVPGLRMSRWALGLVSFFLVLLLPGIIAATRDLTGGLEGITVPRPDLFGVTMDTTAGLFILAVVLTGVWFVVFRNLVESRYGMALRAFRESPVLLQSLGQSSAKLKLSAYVLGSLPAGAAGCVFAHLSGYISPTSFTMALTLSILAATVLGGADSIYGAVLGAVILVIGPLQTQEFQEYSVMAYGAFLLIVGLLFRDGVAGLVRDLLGVIRRRMDGSPEAVPREDGSVEALRPIDGAELKVEDVSVVFGPLRAVDGVSMTARPGEVTAIIGANGAGKTTLLNAICGFLPAASGRVSLAGQEIQGQSAARVARAGVARGFQTPLIPRGASFAEVVEVGQMRNGRLGMIAAILRLPSFRRQRRTDQREAEWLLRSADLGHLAHTPASEAPLGTRRLLEVLRSAAGNPRVILMDEPAAGLDDDSLEALRSLIDRLREAGATVVLIEHNVPFVLGLADHVVVLEAGAVIATGTADEVRSDQQVIDSYLGRRPASADQTDLEVSTDGHH